MKATKTCHHAENFALRKWTLVQGYFQRADNDDDGDNVIGTELLWDDFTIYLLAKYV